MSTDVKLIQQEFAHFFGVTIGLMAYGVHLTLFVVTAALLGRAARSIQHSQLYLLYICLQFALSSMAVWTDIYQEAAGFILHNDSVGAPLLWWSVSWGKAAPQISLTTYTACNWLQECLLLYRFTIFYSWNRWIAVVPGILFLAEAATSLVYLARVNSGDNLYGGPSINWGTAYYSCSIAFNMTVTLLVVGRLYLVRRQIRDFVPVELLRTYVSVSAMLVESAALYSVTALVFIACYAHESIAQYTFISILGQVQSIAPLLIILRAAQGRAWSHKTMNTMQAETTIRFTENPRLGVATNLSAANATGSATSSSGREPSTAVNTSHWSQSLSVLPLDHKAPCQSSVYLDNGVKADQGRDAVP